jgi:hypothetical protein
VHWAVEHARSRDPDDPCAFLVYLLGEIASGYGGPAHDPTVEERE